MLPFVSWSQGGKKTGPETEAERGMQNAAGSLQAQATITMSIYSAAGGRSYGRQGFPSSVLCTWYPESSAPQIFIFSLLDITRKHLTARNRAQVFCKWKSPVLWKMQGFIGRQPAQVKPSLLEWSLKLGSKDRRAKVEWLANKKAENWHRAPTMATKALRASQGRTQFVGVSLISLPFTGACRECSRDFTGLSARSAVFFSGTRASTYLTAETA